MFDTDKYPYYLFKELCTRCIGPDNYKIYGQPVQKYWYDAESNMFAGMSEVLAQAAKMEDNNARAIYITSYCNAMQTKAFEDGKQLLKNLTPEVPPATIIAEDLTSNCTEIEYHATLKDNNGIGIANKTLIFEVNGKSYSGITNSKGIATVFLTLPNGDYSINVSFKGDDKLGKKTAHATITINSAYAEDLPVPEIEQDYEKWQKFDLPLASNGIATANESVILTNNQTNNTNNSDENNTIARNIKSNGTEYIIALISVVATVIIAAIFIKKYKH